MKDLCMVYICNTLTWGCMNFKIFYFRNHIDYKLKVIGAKLTEPKCID